MERKGKPSALMNKEKIIDRDDPWRIRHLKELAHNRGKKLQYKNHT